MHANSHPKAGQTVRIKTDVEHFQYPDFGSSEFRLEDWWDRVGQDSWRISCENGNIACIIYYKRVGYCNLPLDDDVVYGKVGAFGSLVHVSEIDWD